MSEQRIFPKYHPAMVLPRRGSITNFEFLSQKTMAQEPLTTWRGPEGIQERVVCRMRRLIKMRDGKGIESMPMIDQSAFVKDAVHTVVTEA